MRDPGLLDGQAPCGQGPYGQGRAGRRRLLPFVFDELRLHRLEAACRPHNEASRLLLEGVGFQQEGYARSYLRINGVWQDHLLFALLENEPVRPSQHR